MPRVSQGFYRASAQIMSGLLAMCWVRGPAFIGSPTPIPPPRFALTNFD